MRIFVSGPFGDHLPDYLIAAHVAQADQAARDLKVAGHIPFCPHTMTNGWQKDERLAGTDWPAMDMTFIEHWAEGVLRLPGDSLGSDREVAYAHALGKPVYHRIADIPMESEL